MKKILTTLLVILITACLLLSGCNSGDESGSQSKNTASTLASTPTVAPQTQSTSTSGTTGAPAASDEPSITPEVTPAATPTQEPTATPVPTEKPDYSGGIVSDEHIDVAFYPEIDTSILQAQSGTGISIALQFNATAPFYGIGFHSPTWTKTEGFSVDYYIYEWNTDYYETIDSDPVIEISTEGWVDGQCAQVVFEDNTELPAGEYVLLAKYQSSKDMCNAGVYYMEKEFEWTRAYKNDEIWEDVSIVTTVFYSKTPVNLYGPISDSGIE